MMSLLPPGACGTMTRIGFVGYGCVVSSRDERCAASAPVANASAATNVFARVDFIPTSSECGPFGPRLYVTRCGRVSGHLLRGHTTPCSLATVPMPLYTNF